MSAIERRILSRQNNPCVARVHPDHETKGDTSAKSHFIVAIINMATDPRERIANLRSLIRQQSQEFNFHVRRAASAINDFDGELDHLYGLPTGDGYSSATLIRFDQELRELIRTLVRLKLHMYRYREATRPLEQQLMTLTRGPALDQRMPLGENRCSNLPE